MEHFQQGNLELAINSFNEAIAANPEDATAIGTRGVCYYMLGQHEKALEDCFKFLELQPQAAVGFVNRGNVYSEMGLAEKSISDYTAAIKLDPADALTYSSRASQLLHLGDLQGAIDDYTTVLSLEPGNHDALMNRGMTYKMKNEFGKAIADMNAAIEICPDNITYLSNRANTYFSSQDFEKCADENAKIIEIQPCAVAYANRANALSKLKRFKDALYCLDQALELDPEDVESYQSRALIYHQIHDFDRAAADYTAVLSFDPDNPMMLFGRSQTLAAKGETSRAIDDLTLAIEKAGAQPFTVQLLVHRGNLNTRAANFTAAISDYTEAANKGLAKDAFVLLGRGAAYSSNGDYEKGLADFDKVLQLDKGSVAKQSLVVALTHKANTYNKMGRYDDAEKACADALAIDASCAHAYVFRTIAAIHKSDWKKAKEYYDEAQKHGQGHSEAKSELARLKPCIDEEKPLEETRKK